MENKPDISLIKAYLDGNCTVEEEKQVESWLAESPVNIEYLTEVTNTPDFDADKILNQIVCKIEC